MGVLGICLTQPHRYEEEEINLLTSFARQAGIAIENAQLYKEVKDKAEHIGILYRIARAVKASLDVEVFALSEYLQIAELRRGTRIHREKSSCG